MQTFLFSELWYGFIHEVNMQIGERGSLPKTYNYITKLVRCQSSQVHKQLHCLLHSMCSTPFSFFLLNLFINYMTRFQLLRYALMTESLYVLSFALRLCLVLTKRIIFLKNKENYKKIFYKRKTFWINRTKEMWFCILNVPKFAGIKFKRFWRIFEKIPKMLNMWVLNVLYFMNIQ